MTTSKEINNNNVTEAAYLSKYDAGLYDRPSITVDMIIFTVADKEKENYRRLSEKALKLLMIKRGQHPYLGQWALPGGFVSTEESLDQGAIRELKAETNIENIYMEQLYTWGEVDRDPRTRVISSSYIALVDSEALDIKAGDDAVDAAWFELKLKLVEEKRTIKETGYILERVLKLLLFNTSEELSATIRTKTVVEGKVKRIEREIIESRGIAFDHSKMIEYALERLKNKIEYTDIAFNLMPELFTLTELQQVYEIILDKELLAAAFRRKIADMVIETNQSTKNAGHRPSKLYKFNPMWSR